VKPVFAVFRKELRQYFSTPVAYALLAVFWALSGYYFSFNVFFVHVAQMVNAFHNMSILLMLVMPLLTMRIFAEENRAGTTEFLLSLPLGEPAIVFGKFLAALVVLGLMIGGTATTLVPLTVFGHPDLGPVIGGYLGVFLLGTAFLAIGLFISALCSNQLVAALVTWAVFVLLWYIDYAVTLTDSAPLVRLLMHLCFSQHYVDLIRGVLTSPTVAYFGGIVAAFLALTVQALRMRRA
jgi:ABC-2 type transport system permease protein